MYTVHLYKASFLVLYFVNHLHCSLVLFLNSHSIKLNDILFDVTGGTILFLFDATDIIILD